MSDSPRYAHLVVEEQVAELVLESAPLNEIGSEMLEALEGALDVLETTRARVLIVHSTNPKGFSAGADLRQFYHGLVDASSDERDVELSRFIDRIHGVMNRLDCLRMPVIAVIHGVCFGGGFELALTADVRIVEKNARFAFPELRLGLIPGFGGIPRLRRDVGNALVRDVLMTGRSLNAKKAVECGLASQMVAGGHGLRVARRMAEQMLKFDSDVSAEAKAFTKPLLLDELAEEKRIFLRLAKEPRVAESLRRFVEDTGPMPYLPRG